MHRALPSFGPHATSAAVVPFALLVALAGGPAAAADAGPQPCDQLPIRSVSLAAPLAVTPWALADKAAARNRLEADLRGQPYSAALVRAARALIESHAFAALASDAAVDFRFIKDTVNCADGAADLSFYVFAPRTTARVKLGASGATVHGSGIVEYDRAERLSATASAYALLPAGTALSLDARQSPTSHLLALGIGGALQRLAPWLSQADWRVDLLQRLDPQQQARRRQQRLAAGGSVQAQPFGADAPPVYAAGLIETGQYADEGGGPAAAVADDRSRYHAATLFVRADGRADRTHWAAIYGLERGDPLAASRSRWTRQVWDLAVDHAVPLGAARAALEARFAAGELRSGAGAPGGIRLAGGGRERLLVPTDAQSPRAAALFRALGSGELPAASRFAAVNLTLGVTVYREPVIPAELNSNEEFQSKLAGGLASVIAERQSAYTADDPRFQAALARLPGLRAALQELGAQVQADQPGWPPELESLARNCTRAVDMAERRARGAVEATSGGAQFGFLRALLPPGWWADEPEDRLGAVHTRCGDELQGRVSAAALAARVAAVDAVTRLLVADMTAVDVAQARRKAETELAPATAALDKILNDFDLLAVSPLLMVDTARLDGGRLRRGVGAGLRVALVSTVDLDIGYMANRSRAPGEPAGAFFMTLNVRDFF